MTTSDKQDQVSEFFDYTLAGDTSLSEPADQSVGTFLGGCSEREWRVLQRHSTIEVLSAGQALMNQGDTDQSLFVVLAGELSAAVPGVSHADRPRMLPGDVLGEVSFFDGQPRSAAVVATEESRIMRIRFEAFEALSASEPALARTLLMDLGRALARRLRAAEARAVRR